jgi:hypothetical protein
MMQHVRKATGKYSVSRDRDEETGEGKKSKAKALDVPGR